MLIDNSKIKKLILLSMICLSILVCFNPAHAVATIITDVANTINIDWDFSTDTLDSYFWNTGYTTSPNFTASGFLTLNYTETGSRNIWSQLSVEYNTSAIGESGNGNITISSRVRVSNADLQDGQFFGFLKDNDHRTYLYFNGASEDIDVYANGSFVCDDITSGGTLTDFHIYTITTDGDYVTYLYDGSAVCTHYFHDPITISAYMASGGVNLKGEIIIDYVNYTTYDFEPTLDSVVDTPDPIEIGEDITFIGNWTEKNYQGTKMYICKSDALTTNSSCTGGAWCSNTTVFDAVTPSTCSYTTLAADGRSNDYYAFVCDESILCSASTSGTFTVASLNITITNPANNTYMTSNITFDYLAESVESSPYNCTWTINGLNSTTDTVENNTVKSIDFTEYNPNYYNLSVNCYDGASNETQSRGFTIDDVNYTVIQDSSGYETSEERFNLTVGVNPDIMDYTKNGFFWNNTNYGYDSITIKDVLTNISYKLFQISIIKTNNSAVATHWNISKVYKNGTTFEENTTNTNYNVLHNYFLSSSVYEYNILEGNATNHIRINVTKLNSLDLAVINPVLNWNGLPISMNRTFNETSYYGFKYNESVPFLDSIFLNVTQGFNITSNISATTDSGYNSRLESNSSYNYTQRVHNVQLVNCSIRGISALNFTFKDENSKVILRADADYNFTFDYSQEKNGFNELNNTNNTYCLFPHWFNDSITGTIRYDEANTYDDEDRNYYLVNVTLNNITSNYNLLLLDSGSKVVFNVRDGSTNEYITDSLVQALKYNDVLDVYELTGERVTDDYGSVSIYLELNKVYRMVIYWGGASYIQKLLVTTTSHSLVINPSDIEAWYNHTTRPTTEFNYSDLTNYSWIYVIDNDGTMNSASLLVRDVTIGSESTLCDITNFTAGSFYIFCYLGNTSDKIYHAYATVIYEDGFSEIIFSGYFTLGVPTAWGNNGVIIGIYIMLLFSMAGILLGASGVLLLTWFALLINVLLNFWALPYSAVAVTGLIVGVLFMMKGQGD